MPGLSGVGHAGTVWRWACHSLYQQLRWSTASTTHICHRYISHTTATIRFKITSSYPLGGCETVRGNHCRHQYCRNAEHPVPPLAIRHRRRSFPGIPPGYAEVTSLFVAAEHADTVPQPQLPSRYLFLSFPNSLPLKIPECTSWAFDICMPTQPVSRP
jgi:hypothetical protein